MSSRRRWLWLSKVIGEGGCGGWKKAWRVAVCRLGLCNCAERVDCLSRDRERSRWIKWLMRRGCGGGGVETYMGGKSGVERKLLVVGGKLAVGSMR